MSRQTKNGAVKRLRYIVPAGVDLSDVELTLCEHFPCEEAPVHLQQRTYYDSFDWRCHAAGGVLEEISGPGGLTLVWRDWGAGDAADTAVIKRPVRFLRDLPPGGLRERIEPLLEMRALLPLAGVRCKVHALSMLNKDKKTVVRLHIEESRLTMPTGSARTKLPVILIVEPVKGYVKAFQAAVQIIDRQLALEVDRQSWMQRVMEAAGILPGAYTAKLNLRLTPDMRADAAMRAILLRLLDMMQDNEAGVKADWDSEFLHDFRVAVRRTRTALAQIKGVLPRPKWERFRREFNWLGNITTPTRDLDVYLLTFGEYKNSLPLLLGEDLNPFRDFLEKHRKIEHRRLVNKLESARYRKLTADWHAYLTSPLPRRSSLPNALCPARKVADQRIWRMYRRVIKEGQAIQPDSPPADLHELRKSCKKLRYLMEFFTSLYPPAQIRQLINALKSLQDQLGEYQDLHVQLAALATFRTGMVAEGSANERTLVAMDLVMQMLDQRQEAVRQLFKSRFFGFSDEKIHGAFGDLFKHRPEKEHSGL